MIPKSEEGLLSLNISIRIIEKCDQYELYKVYPFTNEVVFKNYLQEKVEDIIKSFESPTMSISVNIKCKSAEKFKKFL
jgi:hypothetical protein